MRTLIISTLAAAVVLATVCVATQVPRRENRDAAQPSAGTDAAVARLMAFDKNGDGKLTKEELADERLHRLFDRADANQDGLVTTQELTTLLASETSAFGGGRGGPGSGGPPDGPGAGGPDGGPRGAGGGPGGRGPGGPGGFGAPPQPGQIMPTGLQDALGLSDKQKQQLAELQKEVDSRLDKILTSEQKQQLRELRDRGPGGFGPPPTGAGGPGGGNPGDRRRPDAKKKNN
jgi:hypothetical protein